MTQDKKDKENKPVPSEFRESIRKALSFDPTEHPELNSPKKKKKTKKKK